MGRPSGERGVARGERPGDTTARGALLPAPPGVPCQATLPPFSAGPRGDSGVRAPPETGSASMAAYHHFSCLSLS